jgi:hypothetical protein
LRQGQCLGLALILDLILLSNRGHGDTLQQGAARSSKKQQEAARSTKEQ